MIFLYLAYKISEELMTSLIKQLFNPANVFLKGSRTLVKQLTFLPHNKSYIHKKRMNIHL